MRRLRRAVLVGGCLAVLLPNATPAVEFARAHVPNMAVVGEGRMSYLFWDLYDATLYAPGGEWRLDSPYALRLTYLRPLSGRRIAEVSAEEIARLEEVDAAQLNTWLEQMAGIFPDVDAGTELTGVRDANGHALFYRGDELIGRIADTEFSRRFFGIWLDERTSAGTLRQELLGESKR